MPTHAVIWIDHQEARVFHVHPDCDRRHNDPGAAASSPAASQRAWRGQRAPPMMRVDSSARWREPSMASMPFSSSAPPQPKLELFKYLHEHDRRLAEKVVGVESAYHPTDGENIARAKNYFIASDRMG